MAWAWQQTLILFRSCWPWWALRLSSSPFPKRHWISKLCPRASSLLIVKQMCPLTPPRAKGLTASRPAISSPSESMSTSEREVAKGRKTAVSLTRETISKGIRAPAQMNQTRRTFSKVSKATCPSLSLMRMKVWNQKHRLRKKVPKIKLIKS